MNWIAVVVLHSALTFVVVALLVLVRLVLWLALRRCAPATNGERPPTGRS